MRKTQNDRRICTLFSAQQQAADLARDGMVGDYFPSLYNWLRADGYAIVSELLHTFPIPNEYNPATGCQRAPVTSSTAEAIKGSTGGIEREEGDPQVGDKASPDGTFEMPDGKTIVVEDGVITDIQTAGNEGNEGGEGGSASSTDNDTVAKLQQQVAALKQQLNDTKAQLASAQKLAKSKEDMRILNAVKMAGGAEKVLAGFSSHYQPAQRQPSGKGAGDNVNAVEEGKNAIKERLAKLHKKGKK